MALDPQTGEPLPHVEVSVGQARGHSRLLSEMLAPIPFHQLDTKYGYQPDELLPCWPVVPQLEGWCAYLKKTFKQIAKDMNFTLHTSLPQESHPPLLPDPAHRGLQAQPPACCGHQEACAELPGESTEWKVHRARLCLHLCCLLWGDP